jgi:Site-specific recombinase XerD
MINSQVLQIAQITKQDEIIKYIEQKNGYLLKNDKWSIYDICPYDLKKTNGIKYLNFASINNEDLKLEFKYYFLYLLIEKKMKPSTIMSQGRITMKKIGEFTNTKTYKSIIDIPVEYLRLFLQNNNYSQLTINQICGCAHEIILFYKYFYDDREEVEKDIWYSQNIKGARISAIQERKSMRLDFTNINVYYRGIVKRYMRTLITKKSFSYCCNILTVLNEFFNTFYKMGYTNGFLKNLSRQDIEKYIYAIDSKHKKNNKSYSQKFISYVRTFLEYIQLSQYEEAPLKEVSLLIFEMDIPTRENDYDRLQRVKFIPEPILKQIDNNIMNLDVPEFIPVYILLRETGWRGTDILNLRYDNCIERIWNSKEKRYNCYLCGEITKTGIAQLKIPIRDKVVEMLEKCIEKAKANSVEDNNPKKYLFNTYEGKLKGYPISKQVLLNSIKRLIIQYDIRDQNGELYHFKLHSLRHTRAKEFVEQGIGISVIQQILGHRSLQMTVHYATVTENVLYEKWKTTEDLNLFKVSTETHNLERVDLSSEYGDSLVRYEYVKKNLDAVRVPFGVCFKPSKLTCKQQMNFCLTCASFCTTIDNIPEYEEEIEKVKQQIEISNRCGRELWTEKNREYLKLLEETLEKVKQQKIVHKNGASREEV